MKNVIIIIILCIIFITYFQILFTMCEVKYEPLTTQENSDSYPVVDKTDNLKISKRMGHLDNILSELTEMRDVVNKQQAFIPKITHSFKDNAAEVMSQQYDISISDERLNQIIHVDTPIGAIGEPGIIGLMGDNGDKGDQGDEGEQGYCGLDAC